MRYEDVLTDLPLVAAEHDDRHRLRTEAHCREAAAFMFALPEEGLAGFLYPWVNNKSMAGSAVCLFGPSIAEPIQERFDEVAVPDSMTFKDWNVRRLTMKLGDPHRSVELCFRGERVQIDCRYEALHPPYAFSSHKDGCPSYYADDRTEQHGRLTGTLVVDGRTITLDTFMQRDHSWGTRIWGLNQHYKWFHATTAQSAVHFFEMQSFGRTLLRGYVFKHGRMAEIRSVTYEFAYDDNMHHEAIDVVATDSAGRETRIDCKVFAKFQYDADPMIVLNEGATTLSIDGIEGTGWCEFCWNKGYYEFAKQYVSEFGHQNLRGHQDGSSNS